MATHPHAWPVDIANLTALNAYAGRMKLNPDTTWLMSPAEQAALIGLLSCLRPEIAIEIGVGFGGSLQVTSRYAGRVFALDLDPKASKYAPQRNVTFVPGDSKVTFPALLRRLYDAPPGGVGYVLIDGDHSFDGVRADIAPLLALEIDCPLFVVMHDSFNPEVREGIRAAPWASSPFAHSVELDFVSGSVPGAGHEMWGGLALALLLPERRAGGLAAAGMQEYQFSLAKRHRLDKAAG